MQAARDRGWITPVRPTHSSSQQVLFGIRPNTTPIRRRIPNT